MAKTKSIYLSLILNYENSSLPITFCLSDISARAVRVPSCLGAPPHQAGIPPPYLLHQRRELSRRLHWFVLDLPQRLTLSRSAPPTQARLAWSPTSSPTALRRSTAVPTRCRRLESRLAEQQPSPILLYMVLSRFAQSSSSWIGCWPSCPSLFFSVIEI